MSYQAIENYGIIGNMRTAALVSQMGSLDWLCYPHFDHPTLFAALLDDKKGGTFRIRPKEEHYTSKQFYWQDTNVLVTRFMMKEGACELIDYMPVGESDLARQCNGIVRKIRVLRGSIRLEIFCRPAFDYARAEHKIEKENHKYHFQSVELEMTLHSNQDLHIEGDAVNGEVTLEEGEQAYFMLTASDEDLILSEEVEEKAFYASIQYWRDWLSQCTYRGRWREMVYRSALTLKLLTFQPTGAIIAALTTSLPEHIGGERNWDYRYTWIRDAAFTVYAFMRIGFNEEANRFMNFIEKIVKDRKPNEPLQIMFGINGEKKLTEKHLAHLEGYKNSKPVRIGNGAYDQLQLDIYGELMDSVYLSNKYGTPVSHDFWLELRELTNWIADNWQRKDAGIWEVRGGDQHFVYSKLMSWVALDRAIRLAEKRSFPSDKVRWTKVRDEIYEEMLEKAWSEDLKAFTQTYEGDALDASNLLMTMTFFMSPSDPRMLSMLDAMNRPVKEGGLVSNDLVFRYDLSKSPDGLEGEEGTFNICTFWMVEALARAGKTHPEYLEEARLMFEHMLSFSNHLGLYAEETGVCGEALGNFPQAFTHLALISAAYNLDKVLG
ncbi:MAG: glycoside hydrolase family 15 protein [Bacteroidota bacterium]